MVLRRPRRRGTILVEAALVYPVLFLLLLAIASLAVGVFRFQQVAHVAREAARWASVHGAQYALETGNPAATPADVYANAIVPQAAGMDLNNLSYAVAWTTGNAQTSSVTTTDASGLPNVASVSNTVSVTVCYTWNTGLFGTIPVTSTAVTPMNF